MMVEEVDEKGPYDGLLDEPWTLVTMALAYQARGEPLPEDLGDAVTIAVAALTGATFRQAGMSEEAIERQFLDREWQVRLGYDPKTEELSASVEWEDGTTTSATAPPTNPEQPAEQVDDGPYCDYCEQHGHTFAACPKRDDN